MTTYSCPEARALVSDYIDGELPDATARSLEEHLETCEHCPPLYASLVETLAALKAHDDAAGLDEFVLRVVTALVQPEPGNRQ